METLSAALLRCLASIPAPQNEGSRVHELLAEQFTPANAGRPLRVSPDASGPAWLASALDEMKAVKWMSGISLIVVLLVLFSNAVMFTAPYHNTNAAGYGVAQYVLEVWDVPEEMDRWFSFFEEHNRRR